MTVWLLRHGMTADNARGRYQGRRDTPLSRRRSCFRQQRL